MLTVQKLMYYGSGTVTSMVYKLIISLTKIVRSIYQKAEMLPLVIIFLTAQSGAKNN